MLTAKDAPRLSRLGILRANIERIVKQTKAEIAAANKVKKTPSQPKNKRYRISEPAGTSPTK